MASQGNLIINASYKDFFIPDKIFPLSGFVFPEIEEIRKSKSLNLTRSLGLILKSLDSDKNALYGVEIKTNGSERSSRIPLVRHSSKTTSIWKVSPGVNSFENTAASLNDLVYFLSEHSDKKDNLPIKVVILNEKESIFSDIGSAYYEFVNNIIKKNNLVLFSIDYLLQCFKEGNVIDFDNLFNNKESINFNISKEL